MALDVASAVLGAAGTVVGGVVTAVAGGIKALWTRRQQREDRTFELEQEVSRRSCVEAREQADRLRAIAVDFLAHAMTLLLATLNAKVAQRELTKQMRVEPPEQTKLKGAQDVVAYWTDRRETATDSFFRTKEALSLLGDEEVESAAEHLLTVILQMQRPAADESKPTTEDRAAHREARSRVTTAVKAQLERLSSQKSA